MYIGKRLGLGIGLLLAYIPAHLPIYFLGWKFYWTVLPGVLILLGHFIISLTIAYDVWMLERSK